LKASLLWLRALVPGLDADAKTLAERFTGAGLEVEAVMEYGAGAESCVLAWVVSSRQHPTKSGLKLVTVDRGGGTQKVVCGAPNVPEPGGVVVLAPLGAHLPAKNMTIARREIGGVASEGMLCSEAELGLSEDAAGIIVFPPGFAEPGARFTDVVPEARDTIFEIGLTPNRPDGLGHVGLAREAAALFGIAWRVPEPESPARRSDRTVESDLDVRIDDAERCPHYGASIVTGVTIAPSPPGVRYRLSALGVRPISNAVDVTNLMMLEHGHPMHAFDADKVRGGRIVVRRARDGESLVTLDGVTRTLGADDLVIADAEGAIALAGVMGGLSSEITASTKRIVLECAYFDPRGVRRAARRYGLHSESSHRFERGVDHGDTPRVLEHATAVTCRLAGGTASKDLLVRRAKDIPPVRLTLRAARMRALLGVDVPLDEAAATLGRLGFSCERASNESLAVIVPTHRPDVGREVDLDDEVIRVRGMDTVPAALPAVKPTRPVAAMSSAAVTAATAEGREAWLRRVRTAASSLGLAEALLFGFTSNKALDALGAPSAIAIENPLTEDTGAMRTSLLPGLFDAVRRARRYGVTSVRLFSTGSIFLGGGAPPTGIEERASFAAVLAGDRPAHLARPEPYDVWDASGLATALVPRLVHASAEVVQLRGADAPKHLHPRGAAAIRVHDVPVGVLGPLHPDVADALDTGDGLVVLELDLDALQALGAAPPAYVPIARFPAATRDIALVVRDGIPAGDVLATLRETAGPLAVKVELFDRFVGGSVPAGHASLAFHVVYQAPVDQPRTLTDAEVDAAHEKVVAAMKQRFGASLR
jgi:phenylalanyl-tRNA synthetase beta chain